MSVDIAVYRILSNCSLCPFAEQDKLVQSLCAVFCVMKNYRSFNYVIKKKKLPRNDYFE